LSSFTGILFLLAFAPFGVSILAAVSIGYLFFLCLTHPPKIVAQCYFCFGLVLFISGMYWLYISIHTVSGGPIWLAILLIAILSVFMALYYALAGYLISFSYTKFQSKSLTLLIIAPAIWGLIEWFRGWFLSGFPWFSVGYSQTNTYLSNWSPIGGVYMVSWICGICAGLLALIYVGNRQQSYKGAGALILIIIVSLLLGTFTWTQSTGEKLTVSLVQGGIQQERKWLPNEFRKTLDLYKSSLEASNNSDLVIWPEVAIPSIANNLEHYLDDLRKVVKENKIQLLLFGILTSDEVSGEIKNSMMAIGSSDVVYHKRHLLPFGEYFPVPNSIRSWLQSMGLPNRDIERGEDIQRMSQLSNILIAPSICYEDIFGSELLRYFPEANLLVNITNNAWFGKSFASAQHFQMSRMRAIETGRYLLRATNTGVTAIVGPNGTVRKRAEPFKYSLLLGTYEPMVGSTPYIKYGNSLIVILMILSLCLGYLLIRKQIKV
jgi:apolipoprotein N-acyltransferase